MRFNRSARSRLAHFFPAVSSIVLLAVIASPASAGFTLTIYEQTGSINAYTFQLDDIRLYDDTAGLPGPPSRGYIGYDFDTGGCEFYDIFFCDSSGTALGTGPGDPLPQEVYLKIECNDLSCVSWLPVAAPTWNGAGNNIDAVVLDLGGLIMTGIEVTDAVYGLCEEPFEIKTSGFASSALGLPDADITKMGGGETIMTIYMGSIEPEPPDTTIAHDPLAAAGHPFFEWYENGIQWNGDSGGHIIGVTFSWYDAIISRRSFDPTQAPFMAFRFYMFPDSSNFMGGYTSSVPPDNEYHYNDLDLGIYIHSTGTIRPTWDVNNYSYWSTTLPAGYYDVMVSLDGPAGTVSFAIDRVAGWWAPFSDFSTPVWSAVEHRPIGGPYHVQIHPYNEKSRIYDVWSSRGGEVPPPPPPPQPFILVVEDVGNDEGRQVRMKWRPSPLDAPGSAQPVTGYALWRRIDPLPAPMPLYPPGEWDYMGTVPACCEESYAAIVPTLADSTGEHGIHWSVFFVRALTGTPETYFDSPPDSGYSVRDILPSDPGGEPEPAQADDYLGRNYPNPFNPSTEIRFGLKGRGHVLIRIFDAGGRLVRTLVDGEMDAGDHVETWNGTGDDGRIAASGVYFCRLETKRISKSRKMVLLR